MKSANQIHRMTTAALLCAIGIVIPLFSPIKIVMEPASYTLASHVAIMIAMFISPATAVIVSLGTTAGFFLAGFPLVIVLRAATHVVFSLCGALVLQRNAQLLDKAFPALIFSFALGLVHAVCEMLVVMPFYFGSGMSQAYYAKGFVVSVVLLVGVGTVVHSMVDFAIALLIWRPLRKIAPAAQKQAEVLPPTV
jgi:niacin transporter